MTSGLAHALATPNDRLRCIVTVYRVNEIPTVRVLCMSAMCFSSRSAGGQERVNTVGFTIKKKTAAAASSSTNQELLVLCRGGISGVSRVVCLFWPFLVGAQPTFGTAKQIPARWAQPPSVKAVVPELSLFWLFVLSRIIMDGAPRRFVYNVYQNTPYRTKWQ